MVGSAAGVESWADDLGPFSIATNTRQQISVNLRIVISLILSAIGNFERWNGNGGDVKWSVIILLCRQDGLSLLFRNLCCKCIKRLFFTREGLGEGKYIELRPNSRFGNGRRMPKRCSGFRLYCWWPDVFKTRHFAAVVRRRRLRKAT